jgi:hypothetical protein
MGRTGAWRVATIVRRTAAALRPTIRTSSFSSSPPEAGHVAGFPAPPRRGLGLVLQLLHSAAQHGRPAPRPRPEQQGVPAPRHRPEQRRAPARATGRAGAAPSPGVGFTMGKERRASSSGCVRPYLWPGVFSSVRIKSDRCELIFDGREYRK